MFLLTLGKIFTVLAIGGGSLTTYYLVNKNKKGDSPIGLKNLRSTCQTPFIMKASGGIEMNVETEEEGRDFLNRYYQGQGAIEKCPSYKASK